MSFYLEEFNLTYIAPTRTGSTTIAEWLYQYGLKRRGGGKKHFVEDIRKDCFCVTSVRNPYSRVPSAWSYLRMRKKTSLGFREWLEVEYGRRHKRWSGWSSLRTTITEHLRTVLNKIDFVIHLESLEKDLRELTNQLDMPWHPLPNRPLNITPNKFKAVNLDEKDFVLIRDKNREDFDRFGYSDILPCQN